MLSAEQEAKGLPRTSFGGERLCSSVDLLNKTYLESNEPCHTSSLLEWMFNALHSPSLLAPGLIQVPQVSSRIQKALMDLWLGEEREVSLGLAFTELLVADWPEPGRVEQLIQLAS